MEKKCRKGQKKMRTREKAEKNAPKSQKGKRK
jgi:hypothetical protein